MMVRNDGILTTTPRAIDMWWLPLSDTLGAEAHVARARNTQSLSFYGNSRMTFYYRDLQFMVLDNINKEDDSNQYGDEPETGALT